MSKRQEQPPNSTLQSNTFTLVERYKMVVAARNFHYENYNKWSTYFYVAIGAIFIGYCTIVSAKELDITKKTTLEYLLLLLGYIVSILWYWSCKGYYFWSINFAMLINHYEKTLLKLPDEERIYFVLTNSKIQNNYFSPISGANISTSKVAILFAFLITAVWGFLIINNIFNFSNYSCSQSIFYITAIFISIISTMLFTWVFPRSLLKSKINHYPDLQLDQT